MAKAIHSLLVTGLLLSGCNSTLTLTSDECQQLNWQAIGLLDGTQGAHPKELQAHQQACSQYATKPDTAAYQKGVMAGLSKYCTFSSGLELGQSGNAFNDACAQERYISFGQGFVLGNTQYQLETKLNEASAQLNGIEQKIASLEDKVDRIQTAIESGATKASPTMLMNLQSLQEQLSQLQSKKFQVEELFSQTQNHYNTTTTKIDKAIEHLARQGS